jgi:hypothetical protein
MMAMTSHPRPTERREAKNAHYHDRRVGAGIAKMSVMGPAERMPELRPVLLDWRRDAKPLLVSDLPSADQILEIHGVWTLRTKLPIDPFETPATAEAWPPAQNPRLDARRLHAPKRRSQP